MVVLMVTLFLRVTMRRSTVNSASFSLLKATSAGALVLAFAVACSDMTGPDRYRVPASVRYVHIDIPDSVKEALLGQESGTFLAGPAGVSANVLAPSSAALSSSFAGGGYAISHPAFVPEEIPRIIVPQDSVSNDGLLKGVPLGFAFEFYGIPYDTISIYSNGLIQFGPPVPNFVTGYAIGDALGMPDPPTNIIAFAWTDWAPQAVVGGIRFETRGSAPNRKFIMQFNNVPESGGAGLLMSQVVLQEGSNSITIYTNTLRMTRTGRRVTQGIKNVDGSSWKADSVQNAITGVWSLRVRQAGTSFRLTDDVVRFTPPSPPRVTPPADVAATTAPSSWAGDLTVPLALRVGTCNAAVNPGVATATGSSEIRSIVPVRSDEAALDAAYPNGATRITWTATDMDGISGQAVQAVNVADNEKPLLEAPASLTVNNDPGLGSAVVAVGSADAADNCPDMQVSRTRSDGAASDAPYMVGVTTITWKAADATGNVTTASQSITVLDVEAPSLTVPASFSRNATSSLGVVVPYDVSAKDNVAVTSLVCSPESGSRFAIQVNKVECTASDAAGNSTTRSFEVSVVDAPTQLTNLLQYLLALGLPNGTTNPLANELQQALNDPASSISCKKMGDFLNMLMKKSRDIPSEEIAYMTNEARRIRVVMECR
jgi:hypothetical protein